jgi:hypothetical protein
MDVLIKKRVHKNRKYKEKKIRLNIKNNLFFQKIMFFFFIKNEARDVLKMFLNLKKFEAHVLINIVLIK